MVYLECERSAPVWSTLKSLFSERPMSRKGNISIATTSDHCSPQEQQYDRRRAPKQQNYKWPRRSKSRYFERLQDEYSKAFRSQSFINIWAQVQSHAEATQMQSEPKSGLDYSDLLEPKQDSLAAILRDPTIRLDGILHEYFNASINACNSCGSLLEAIHLARRNNRILRRALHFDAHHDTITSDCWRHVISDLERFSELTNPFSGTSLNQLGKISNVYKTMLKWLTMAHQSASRPRRRRELATKLTTILSRGSGARRPAAQSQRQAQLNAAARGAFALDCDLHTLGRMVRRLCDEIEHGKEIAGHAVKAMAQDGGSGSDGARKAAALRRAARELALSEGWLVERLAELEGHVYLCFLNINRARAMVLREIVRK